MRVTQDPRFRSQIAAGLAPVLARFCVPDAGGQLDSDRRTFEPGNEQQGRGQLASTERVEQAAGVVAFALVQDTWMVSPILSGSMRPGLAVGGVVISQRVRVDSLAVRDVIVFSGPYKPSEQIVHRIVHIAKGKSGQLLFSTQGDATRSATRGP